MDTLFVKVGVMFSSRRATASQVCACSIFCCTWDGDGIMVSKVRWVNTTHFSTWDGQVGQVGR